MDMYLTLVLSFLLAFLVGLERQLSKKSVGFAPYVLVTVLSTAITIASSTLNQITIITGVITGIGFLGAGALIRYHERVFGFTTASTLWVMAVFGIIVGFGDVPMIALVYGIIWLTLILDRFFEWRGMGTHLRAVHIEAKCMGSYSDIRRILSKYGNYEMENIEMNFDRRAVEYTFFVQRSIDVNEIIERVSQLKGIKKIQLE